MNARLIHVAGLGQHPDAIYIGREHSGRGRGPSFKRSRWANPWSVNEHGREAAVALFARWITGDPEAAAMLPPGNWHRPTPDEIRRELRGRVLACWCDPQPCHGHVLAAIADDTPGGEVPPGNHVTKGLLTMNATVTTWRDIPADKLIRLLGDNGDGFHPRDICDPLWIHEKFDIPLEVLPVQEFVAGKDPVYLGCAGKPVACMQGVVAGHMICDIAKALGVARPADARNGFSGGLFDLAEAIVKHLKTR